MVRSKRLDEREQRVPAGTGNSGRRHHARAQLRDHALGGLPVLPRRRHVEALDRHVAGHHGVVVADEAVLAEDGVERFGWGSTGTPRRNSDEASGRRLVAWAGAGSRSSPANVGARAPSWPMKRARPRSEIPGRRTLTNTSACRPLRGDADWRRRGIPHPDMAPLQRTPSTFRWQAATTGLQPSSPHRADSCVTSVRAGRRPCAAPASCGVPRLLTGG